MRQIQDIKAIDFSKEDGLVPAIIQDNNTGKVLMLGYMNEAALEQTLDTGKVTFSVDQNSDFGPKERPQKTS